ncbi:hypothetical protein [Candidatus Thiodubiliella endoseptemdiera]
MNNHQNAIFHQITNFLKTPLALLGVDLKNFQFNKICHFANHPYLCKGLPISKRFNLISFRYNLISFGYKVRTPHYESISTLNIHIYHSFNF